MSCSLTLFIFQVSRGEMTERRVKEYPRRAAQENPRKEFQRRIMRCRAASGEPMESEARNGFFAYHPPLITAFSSPPSDR
jgi:hypothetical protein